VSSGETQIDGSTKPIAAPMADAATVKVMAMTLSFSPNHTAASLAGALSRKGCPMAAKT